MARTRSQPDGRGSPRPGAGCSSTSAPSATRFRSHPVVPCHLSIERHERRCLARVVSDSQGVAAPSPERSNHCPLLPSRDARVTRQGRDEISSPLVDATDPLTRTGGRGMSSESHGDVTPTRQPRLELRVFGSVELSGIEGAEAILVQPKRVALLTYLVLARPRGFHRRDRLVSLFWPEHSADSARAALRKALYAIRQAIGESALVSRGDEELGVNRSTLWCDALEFDA